MKKKLLYFFITAAFAACGDNRTDANTDMTNPTETTTTTDNNAARSGKTIDDMPAAVRTAFQGRYPNAMVEEWERETENNQEVYKVDFKQDDKERKAYFDLSGNFLREEDD